MKTVAASNPTPQQAAASKYWRQGSVLAAILLVAVLSFLSAVRDQAELNREVEDSIEQQRYLAALFNKITETGNVTMRFEAFDPGIRDQRDYMTELYAWGAYTVYPRRIFVADENTPVGLGTQANPFPLFQPSQKWLENHGVVAALTVRQNTLTAQIDLLLAPTTQNGGGQNEAMRIQVIPRWRLQIGRLIWAVSYLGLLGCVGWALALLISGGRIETGVGTTMLLGAVAVGFLLFWLSLAGLKPSRTMLLFFGVASLACIASRRRRWRRVSSGRSRWSWQDAWLIPFGVVIIWAGAMIVRQAFDGPYTFLDATGTWGLKSRVLSTAPIAELQGYFHDLSLSSSHLDYPLLLPFLNAGAIVAIGGKDEMLGKIVPVYLYFGYGLLIYEACHWRLSRPAAGALAALALSAPMFLHWAPQGTADVAPTAFFAAGIYHLWCWVGARAPRSLWLAGIFGAACAFTKNEGLPLMAIIFTAAAMFGTTKSARNLGLIAAVLMAAGFCLLPWFAFRATLPHTDENYFAHLNFSALSAHAGRLPEILRVFMGKMFFDGNWAPLWWLVAGAFMAGICRRPTRELCMLSFILAAQLCVYVLAYVISPYPLRELLNQTSDRLLLQALPAGILLAAASFARFIPREDLPVDAVPSSAKVEVRVH